MKLLSKKTAVLAAVLTTSVMAHAFTLIGPYKPWQVPALGYDLRNIDIGGPMTLSEGYRWNVPIVNYAFDQSFLTYFGSNGVVAVERAIRILNNLPPASMITADANNLYINGQPVPRETKRDNGDAAMMGLLDLKSRALALLVEELGLAQPERYVYALRARETETINNVTFTNYLTVRLNYDPITFQTSPFVNSASYGYEIFDPIRPGDYASAVETPLLEFEEAYSTVASGSPNPDLENPLPFGVFGAGLLPGQFFTGLTFDDVGGLRFLLRTNNLAVENLLPNIVGGVPAGGSSPWAPFLGTTNVFFGGTNAFFNTNIFGTNNLIIQGLRPGVNKIRFERVNYDSLLGSLFNPVTNRFTDTVFSNSRPVIQPVERRILQPDILFLAGDLGVSTDPFPILTARSSTAGWQNNDAINGNVVQGGPGVITPRVEIGFSDQLPFFFDRTPTFFGTLFGNILWGSFDGSTNQPIVFPDYGGFTAQELRNIAVGRGGN